MRRAPTQLIPAAAPVGAGAAASASTGSKARKKERKFSETAWFLAAQDPEQLHDVGTGDDIEQETDRYRVEGKLDRDTRKRYSLSETAVDVPAAGDSAPATPSDGTAGED